MTILAVVASFILGLIMGAYCTWKYLEIGIREIGKEYDFVKKK